MLDGWLWIVLYYLINKTKNIYMFNVYIIWFYSIQFTALQSQEKNSVTFMKCLLIEIACYDAGYNIKYHNLPILNHFVLNSTFKVAN